MMNFDIKYLIDRYLEGKTSLEEERRLREYFSSEEVDAAWKQYAILFSSFQEFQKEKFPKSKFIKLSPKRNFNWKIGIAATFLPLIFGVLYYRNYQKEQAEAQIAFEQVKTALQMVSVNYNKGVDKIKYLEKFDHTTNKIVNLDNLK